MELQVHNGWLADARHVPSPNCDARPPGCAIDLLVIHGISLPPGEYGGGWIDALFTNSLDGGAHPYFRAICESRVSAHLLVGRDGALTQYVPLHLRAWHAGASSFQGRERCNDFSIGIELEGCDEEPYEPVQYERLVALARLLAARYPGITGERIVGHCDIAPGRKTDPGRTFDWQRLYTLLNATQQ